MNIRDIGLARELVFRGKSLFDGEWATGGYWAPENGRRFIVVSADDPCVPPDMVPADPATVAVCTGKKDADGTPIFAGDILMFRFSGAHADAKRTVAVLWSEVTGAFVYKDKDGYGGSLWDLADFSRHSDRTDNARIIGNIHDNPELMEGEDE